MLHLGHPARKKIQAKHGLYVIGKRIKRIGTIFKHALHKAKSKLGSKAKKVKSRLYKILHYFHKCKKGKCHTTKVKAVLKRVLGFHPLIKKAHKKGKHGGKKAGKSPSSKKLKKFAKKILGKKKSMLEVGHSLKKK